MIDEKNDNEVCLLFLFLSSFCIIEGPEMVRDFVQMQLQEIQDNIRSRRNKIFLLMEEVQRNFLNLQCQVEKGCILLIFV